mgnify:CR=1 FL=1
MYELKKDNVHRIVETKQQVEVLLSRGYELIEEAKLKKKKVLSRKLTWSSSDTSLATVNARGVVKANNNMKTGTVIIYAKAHNGLTKKVKINIENYAYPSKIKKMYMLSDDIKPLVTEHMAEMTKIVSYFEFENKNQKSQESYKFGDLFLAFYIHTLDKRELSSENFLYCYYELILSY